MRPVSSPSPAGAAHRIGFSVLGAAVTAAMTVGSVLTVGAAFTPAAFAGGKATMGCSQPYTLAPIGTPTGPADGIDYFSQPLVNEGFFTEASLSALLNSLDHNGDGFLCWTIPPGWNGPPATNGASRAGFVNLVDDKVISG